MPDRLTIGMVSKVIKKPIHSIQYAIRNGGAPKPKAGKIGNRWLFSPADVEELRAWYQANRSCEPAAV